MAPSSSLPLRRLLVDAVLGVVVWASVSWMISAEQAADRPADAMAYFWAFGLGALMMVRRRYPLIVLWIAVAGLFAYYIAGYPAVGLGVPTAAALLSAAQFSMLRWSVLASVLLIGVSYGVRLAQGQDFARIVGYELVGELGLMAAAIALGISLKLRDQLREQSHQLAEAIAAEERSAAEAAAEAERSRIARDLHDSLGHQITVVSLHADLARESLRSRPDQADSALDTVSSSATEMMSHLRGTVRQLRNGEKQSQPQKSTVDDAPSSPSGRGDTTSDRLRLAELPAYTRSRLPLRVDFDIPQQPLPVELEDAAVRIIQEALTNVVKHSEAASAHVVVDLVSSGSQLRLKVTDPGPHRPPQQGRGAGSGVVGMEERAQALGGSLRAAPQGAGFHVSAVFPVLKEA